MKNPLSRLRSSVLGCALLVAGLAATTSADAVGTKRFEFDSQDDFTSGDLRGVAVDSQGNLRAGWNLGTVTLANAKSILCTLLMSDGTVLMGTGDGKVLKLSGGQTTDYADTKQMAVTSLVQGKGNTVFAATVGGKIFKLDGPGAMTELPAIADAENIFALAYDAKKDGVYAATGPNGKLFYTQATGSAQLVFDSDETNLVSVAVGDGGVVYTGSSGKGLLYKVTGPGRASVLLNAPGDEVKFIHVLKNGSLFVVANEMGEEGGGGGRRGMGAFMPASSGGGRGRVGKGVLLRVDKEGIAEEMLNRRDTHFTSFTVDDSERAYVGAGSEGRVYTVDDNHTSTLLADIDSRQVAGLSVSGKHKFVIGSDPAAYHEIRGTGGADASWTSKPLDARIRATFGRLAWQADGAVEVQMRTGNASTPDSTWSDWSQAISAPGKPASPPGRYAQLRVRFTKGDAVFRDLSVPYVTDNLRAVVTNVDAKSKRGGSSTEVPSKSSSIRLSWRTDNPDGDQLRYRVSFRFQSQPNTWREITKPDELFTRSELEWETSTLPEGIYRIRVEATDELANSPDKITRHSLDSGPVLVDNTPPVFRALTASGKKVKGEIVDGLGPIARIDFSLNGRNDWRPLSPKDGVYDEPTEEIEIDLSSVVGTGNHLVAIRAFDQAGNFVVRDIELK